MRTMTQPARTAVTLALLFCATVSLQADDVDRYIEAQMRHFHIPGISLAVIRDGRIVKARGYGIADVELDVPMTKERVVEIVAVADRLRPAPVVCVCRQ